MNVLNRMRGRKNRASGLLFEDLIKASCEYYREQGVAYIIKVPECMRILEHIKGGQFKACFAAKSGPDFLGCITGDRFVAFEAKHTDAGRIQNTVITEKQAEAMNAYKRLGANCFVLLSFGYEQYYRVPWHMFRDAKDVYGRKYLKPADLRGYEVQYANGILDFLV